MSAEMEALFTELLFGEGRWLGLILILAIIGLCSERSRILNIVFIPVSIFIGFMYFDNVSVSSDFMWSAILMFVVAVVLIYSVYEREKG